MGPEECPTMEPRGSVAVVTGAAGGIGRALAHALADAGARGVVVADLDGDGARAVAGEISARRPGAALAVACDVSSAPENARLVAAAEEAFGPVDLFCANAGVAPAGGADAPLETWELALGVNVLAHVHAARALLPGWLERGSGHFLATASAAGLLTQIGSAPYAVTKHAAVAFAEWLSVTHGDAGVGVSCLCPMWVNTAMLHGGGEDQDRLVAAQAGAVLEPEQVAAEALQAVREGRFLILPHPEVLEFFRRRAADPDRWLAGMRRLQRQATAAGPDG
jgi:NAD(P)-dependent dehydrogenase (short-subunit alcohol dehydrogenase family)